MHSPIGVARSHEPLQRRAEGVLINARAIPGGGAHFAAASKRPASLRHRATISSRRQWRFSLDHRSALPTGPITLIEPNDVLDAAK